MSFSWTRPNHIPYPNIWLKFTATDLDTNDSVEYTVQDLPENRFDEAIKIMATGFLANAPMAKLKNATNDLDYIEDSVRIWKDILQQRMVHVCFKNDSHEIVGLNFNYVSSRDDRLFFGDVISNNRKINSERIFHQIFLQIKSKSFMQNMKVYSILHNHGNFDVFAKYGVDSYLSSFGVYVPREYAGRKIGEKILEARLISTKYLSRMNFIFILCL